MNERPWKNEQVYLAFDELTRLSESWIEENEYRYGQLSAPVIRERIIQRIVQLAFYPYCFNCTQRAKNGKYPFPATDEILRLDGVSINGKTGEIKLSCKLFIRLCLDFLAEWIKTLLSVIAGYVSVDIKENKPATLVFGLGVTDVTAGGNEAAFEKFCKHGPIQPLSVAGRLIIQEPGLQKPGSDFIIYAKSPVHYLISKLRLGFVNRSRLLVTCLINPFRFLAAIVRSPLMVLLSKDFIQYPVFRMLDRMKRIQSVIITNSNFFQQPLWMRGPADRKFRVHEVYYSQNAIQFVYKEDQVVGYFPPFRHVRVDEQWVWTEGHKKFIAEMGHKGPIHVVGPIVWYLPSDEIAVRSGDTIKIAVFDIAPVYQSVADKMGIIHYYYTADNMIAFIETIVTICEELETSSNRNIQVLVKSKRDFTKGLHDQVYIDYLKQLKNAHKHVEVIDSAANIFALLNGCDLSVSIPYTSVPYVSAYLKKPSVYFDPGGELLFTNEQSPYISTASGREELKLVIKNILLTSDHQLS